jgi:hypothetical protein
VHALAPRGGLRIRKFDEVEQVRGDGVDQCVLVREVAVQRHPLDAELAAESAHGERAQALVIEELQGGVDDLGPVQWCMSHAVKGS